MNFRHRSYQSELLDRPDIPFEDIERNMQELNFINTWLGGHAITVTGVEALMNAQRPASAAEASAKAASAGETSAKAVSATDASAKASSAAEASATSIAVALAKAASTAEVSAKAVTICEIGCGGGDNLLAIQGWCNKRNIPVAFIGIDINPHCTAVAAKRLVGNTQLITSDYKDVQLETQPDIIFSSLFCHHFSDREMVKQLQWMKTNARLGFFINDLHRHKVAYYSIKVLTALFSNSYLVKHDAPLSVARGFTREEWLQFFNIAGISNYSIEWKWAFRWLIVSKNAL